MSRQAQLMAVRARLSGLESAPAARQVRVDSPEPSAVLQIQKLKRDLMTESVPTFVDRAPRAVLPFGDSRVDACLPGAGLPLGRWHELTGEGMEIETAAVAAAFAAVLAAPLGQRGEVVWILRRDDLYAPGLAGLGFPAERLIQVCVRDEAEALAALEDALSAAGVAAAIGEAESPDLTAGRRLQLACEAHGATGFVLRRRPFGGAVRAEPAGTAAATRWKIAPAPSQPPPGEPGRGPPRWRVELERSRQEAEARREHTKRMRRGKKQVITAEVRAQIDEAAKLF